MRKIVTNLSQITGGKKTPKFQPESSVCKTFLSLALVVLKSNDPCNYPLWKIQMHKKSNDLRATQFASWRKPKRRMVPRFPQSSWHDRRIMRIPIGFKISSIWASDVMWCKSQWFEHSSIRASGVWWESQWLEYSSIQASDVKIQSASQWFEDSIRVSDEIRRSWESQLVWGWFYQS